MAILATLVAPTAARTILYSKQESTASLTANRTQNKSKDSQNIRKSESLTDTIIIFELS